MIRISVDLSLFCWKMSLILLSLPVRNTALDLTPTRKHIKEEEKRKNKMTENCAVSELYALRQRRGIRVSFVNEVNEGPEHNPRKHI